MGTATVPHRLVLVFPKERAESLPTAPSKDPAREGWRFIFQPYSHRTILSSRVPLHARLPEPCCEPPWEPSFSWPRFLLWRDLCLGVGPVNQFRSVKKRAPKLRSFSGRKNERTRWAPIMGAQFVLPKMGPEFDPTFRGTTLQNFKTSV